MFYGIATNGGTLAFQQAAPTAALANKLLDDRLKALSGADTNDFLYAWDSSRDYDPEPRLDRIKARVLVINAADDERNPPETGITENAVKRIKDAKIHLIPWGPDSRGHATTGNAKLYAKELGELLATAPKKTM